MQSRVSISSIESYQPAADFRKTGVVGVITGRNFGWDVAGVKSDYASRLIAGGTSLGVGIRTAAHATCQYHTYVCADDKIKRFTPTFPASPIGVWTDVLTMPRIQEAVLASVPTWLRGITTAYLGGSDYLCGWNYGVYRVDSITHTFTRLTSGSVTGFPADTTPIIAICESNGRLCFLTDTTFFWSAPNAPENLVPSLGGAGFQLTGERIGGTPRAMTRTNTGVIIWTTTGALMAEFVGGDAVFRFYTLASGVLPIGQTGIVSLPDGSHVMLAKSGLYRVVHDQPPTLVSPLFSSFIRDYLRARRLEIASLWYMRDSNRLFIGMRGESQLFGETFVLEMDTDKWGVFSELHAGLFEYSSGHGFFAYANPQGIASYFVGARSGLINRENPFAPGTFTGLGSYVDIGFIRAEELIRRADAIQELQTISVYRATPVEGFRDDYIDEGLIDDSAPTTEDEGDVTDTITLMVDEGIFESLRATGVYVVQVLSDLFAANVENGASMNKVPATLALSAGNVDVWTVNAIGAYFALRFRADAEGEHFRVNTLDCTLVSAGQLV